MTQWTFNGANPLVSYGIGFEFSRPLTSDVLRQISIKGSAFADELPRKVEQQTFTIPAGFQTAPTTSDLGGIVFDELERDGSVRKQLAVFPQSITYQVSKYRRWTEFWPTAERLLLTLARIAAESSVVSGYSLNAINRFTWPIEQAPLDMKALLRSDCRLIVADVLDRDDAFHSFYGYYHREADDKRLDNINITVSPNQEGRFVADLTFNLRLLLANPSSDATSVFNPSDGETGCTGHLKRLHDSNNGIFANIILDAIRAGIPGAV